MGGSKRGARTARIGAPLLLAGLMAGCGGTPEPLPTIGSPTPTVSEAAVVTDRPARLAAQWDLIGAPLPADWPDVPVPRGTEVTSAYAIGSEPRRTWTATFAADRGSALDLAEPVVTVLRQRGYVPIAEYVGAASTNTGLYSFAAPTYAIYVVLGEDDGRPNIVITVRGSTDPNSGLPSASGSATPSPSATGSAGPSTTPSTTKSASPSATPTGTRTSSRSASPTSTPTE